MGRKDDLFFSPGKLYPVKSGAFWPERPDMKVLGLILLLLVLTGCSKPAKEGERNLKIVNLASLFGDLYAGGVMVQLVDFAGTTKDIRFDGEPYNLQIPNGPWTIHVVAFKGPKLYQGAPHCGSSGLLELEGEDTEVEIVVTSVGCTKAPPLTMLKVVPNWNRAHWNNAKWVP